MIDLCVHQRRNRVAFDPLVETETRLITRRVLSSAADHAQKNRTLQNARIGILIRWGGETWSEIGQDSDLQTSVNIVLGVLQRRGTFRRMKIEHAKRTPSYTFFIFRVRRHAGWLRHQAAGPFGSTPFADEARCENAGTSCIHMG